MKSGTHMWAQGVATGSHSSFRHSGHSQSSGSPRAAVRCLQRFESEESIAGHGV